MLNLSTMKMARCIFPYSSKKQKNMNYFQYNGDKKGDTLKTCHHGETRRVTH